MFTASPHADDKRSVPLVCRAKILCIKILSFHLLNKHPPKWGPLVLVYASGENKAADSGSSMIMTLGWTQTQPILFRFRNRRETIIGYIWFPVWHLVRPGFTFPGAQSSYLCSEVRAEKGSVSKWGHRNLSCADENKLILGTNPLAQGRPFYQLIHSCLKQELSMLSFKASFNWSTKQRETIGQGEIRH